MMRQRDYINVTDTDGGVHSFLYEFNKHDSQNKSAIHGGRIAELTLTTLDDHLVAEYDRGWVVLPRSYTPEGMAVEEIIERWN